MNNSIMEKISDLDLKVNEIKIENTKINDRKLNIEEKAKQLDFKNIAIKNSIKEKETEILKLKSDKDSINKSTTLRPEKEKIQKQVDALQIINQGIIQKQDDLLKQLQEAKGIFENILL